VTFTFEDYAPSPVKCLDELLRTPRFGIVIEANDVILDLQGHALWQASWSVSRHRDFSCVGVMNCKRVLIQNGTVRNTSRSCIRCFNGGSLQLKNMIFRDYEVAGVECQEMKGDLTVENSVVGQPSSARRPSPETSLALRYRSALLTMLPDEETSLKQSLLASLDDAINSGKSVRHEGAFQFGVWFSGASIQKKSTAPPLVVNIHGLTVADLSLTIPRLTFLSADCTPEGVPRGPAGDPVSERGPSDLRKTLQGLSLGLIKNNDLPRGVVVDPSSENAKLAMAIMAIENSKALSRPCTASATNMPHCSSCRNTNTSLLQRQQILNPCKLRNRDADLQPIFDAVAIFIQNANSYDLSGLNIKTAPSVKYENGRFKSGKMLVLDHCGRGSLSNSPGVEPVLMGNSLAPTGNYCITSTTEAACLYNAGWWGALPGGSTLSSRPVGNVQNVQVVPAFQPYIMCAANS